MHWNIIALIISIVMIILIVGFVRFLDSPWIKAQGNGYRLYQVHGDMWTCWKYKLQKHSLFCWSNVGGEHACCEDDWQYKEWIKEYNMTILT